MYTLTEEGVLKNLETWQVIIPRHDNNGVAFAEESIQAILDNISLTYPGFTIVNCVGFWKDKVRIYKDENLQLIIDVFPINKADSTSYFAKLKSDLMFNLKQEKIYITCSDSKREFVSFDEFLIETGIEFDPNWSKEEKRSVAGGLVQNIDFVLRRLNYETISLKRNIDDREILWERKICGVVLKSVFEDTFSKDARICGADQINELGDALVNGHEIVLIGGYEFMTYSIEKFSYRPLVEGNTEGIQDDLGFLDQTGASVSTKHFVEMFTASIFINYLILREEGYQKEEIEINVGSDGSLQMAKNDIIGANLFRCPAIIPYKEVQTEIIRCLNRVIELFDLNELDSITLLQAKARNRYIHKRAFLRRIVRSRRGE